MDKYFLFAAIFISTASISTPNETQYSDLLHKIQSQIKEVNHLVDEVGRSNIDIHYIEKLKESKAAIAQLKAMPSRDGKNQEEINQLYLTINTILNPENKNIDKNDNIQNRGSGGNGVIRGIVTLFDTETPLTDVSVWLYDSSGNFIAQNSTDIHGRYIFENLSQGQYTTLAKLLESGFIDTVQPNIACQGGLGFSCQIEELTLLDLQENQILQNINIQVQDKPVISGQIIDGAFPDYIISTPTIMLYDELGNVLDSVFGSSIGEYELVLPQSGNYYISVNHSSYQSQLFEDVLCIDDCDVNLGTLIHVENNQKVRNFDFNMKRYATISGTQIDSETLQPLSGGYIYLQNRNSNSASYVRTNVSGEWKFNNVRYGDYYIMSTYPDEYLATIYNDIPCDHWQRGSCDNELGSTIVQTNKNINNIVMKQFKGGTISGLVLNSNNSPIEPTSGNSIRIYDEKGTIFTYDAGIYSSGNYIFNGLDDGLYYLAAKAQNHQDELYPDIPCHYFSCNFLMGEPIEIVNRNHVEGVDFHLNRLNSLEGRVFDNHLNPISSLSMIAVGVEVSIVHYAYTDYNGYYKFEGLEFGNYKVYARGYDDNDQIISQAYDGIMCNDYHCTDADFTPVNVTDNVNGINFTINTKELDEGNVKINLTSNSPNPINNGSIYAYNEQGNYVSSYGLSSDIILPEGDYYFVYKSSNDEKNFIDKVYGGSNCPSTGCVPTTGELVHVLSDSDIQIDLGVDEYFYLDIDFNNLLEVLEVTLFDDNYSEFDSSLFSRGRRLNLTETSSQYIYVMFSSDGYHSQIFDNINCVLQKCNLTLGVAIDTSLNTSKKLYVNLDNVASIKGVIYDSNGDRSYRARVSLLNDLNESSIDFVYTSVLGEYAFNNILPDDYFIKAEPNYAEPDATTYYGNIACEFECQNHGIKPIKVGMGDDLINHDINLIKNGTMSVSGVFTVDGEYESSKVEFYQIHPKNQNLYRRGIRSVDSNGAITPIYLPAGEYKLVVYNNSAPSLHSAYPDTNCDNLAFRECAELSNVVEVVLGENTHIDGFVLHQFGQVKGQVTDNETGELISDASIDFFDDANDIVPYISEVTNNIGTYKKRLRNGSYYLKADTIDHMGQLYNNISCFNGLGIDCELSQGETFTLDYNETITIDFALKKNPTLKINYRDKVSLKNLASSVKIYDNEGILSSINSTDIDEPTHLIDGLGFGDYYIIAKANENGEYLTTGYPDVVCTNINAISSCTGNLEPVTITYDNSALEVNLSAYLNQGINGFVRDEVNGEIVGNIILDIWDESSHYFGTTSTSNTGGFSIYLPEGDYFISTDTNNGFKNEVFEDKPCENAAILGECELTQGQLITVPADNKTPIIIDINLSKDQIYSNGFE